MPLPRFVLLSDCCTADPEDVHIDCARATIALRFPTLAAEALGRGPHNGVERAPARKAGAVECEPEAKTTQTETGAHSYMDTSLDLLCCFHGCLDLLNFLRALVLRILLLRVIFLLLLLLFLLLLLLLLLL